MTLYSLYASITNMDNKFEIVEDFHTDHEGCETFTIKFYGPNKVHYKVTDMCGRVVVESKSRGTHIIKLGEGLKHDFMEYMFEPKEVNSFSDFDSDSLYDYIQANFDSSNPSEMAKLAVEEWESRGEFVEGWMLED